jgi:hypothetical protein
MFMNTHSKKKFKSKVKIKIDAPYIIKKINKNV